MIRPAWVLNPDPSVAVARQRVPRRYQYSATGAGNISEAIRVKCGIRERGVPLRCQILFKKLLRWFAPYGKFLRKLPIWMIFGVKPTVLKWQRWYFAWGSRPGTPPIMPPGPAGQAKFKKPQEWILASAYGNSFPDVKFCIKKTIVKVICPLW